MTIASGAAHFNLLVFTVASVVTRGLRFFLIAALLYRYGEPIRAFIEERLVLITWIFLFAIVGGFLIAKYLV